MTPAATTSTRPASTAPATRWTAVAYAIALAAALVVGWYVAHIPVQVSDSLGNMLEVRGHSYRSLFLDQLTARGFLRPMLWIQIKAAVDLAGAHPSETFRAIHVLQLAAVAALLVRLCQVRTAAQAAGIPLVLAVLFGLHTFEGTVVEAHPINAFLMVIVFVLAAMNLSISRPAWWVDALAALLLVWAALMVESGLLVAVAIVAGRMAGLRGISRWGVALCVALVAGYVLLRFGVAGNGMPGLTERSTGFGFRVIEPSEIVARFGPRPWRLYAYNVAASLLTVLASEPQGGVFTLTRKIVTADDPPTWMIADVATSLLTTVLCVIWLAGAIRRWRAGELTRADQVGLTACAILGANAALGYGYTKDVIMSAGGAVYACIVWAALQHLGRPGSGTLRRAVAAAVVVAVVSTGWAVRAASLPVTLTTAAFKTRNDWATVRVWMAGQHMDASGPGADALITSLRKRALRAPVPRPSAPSGWITNRR